MCLHRWGGLMPVTLSLFCMVFEVQTGNLLNSCRQGRRAVLSCPCCVSIWGLLKWRTPKIVQMIGRFFFENRWFGVHPQTKNMQVFFGQHCRVNLQDGIIKVWCFEKSPATLQTQMDRTAVHSLKMW